MKIKKNKKIVTDVNMILKVIIEIAEDKGKKPVKILFRKDIYESLTKEELQLLSTKDGLDICIEPKAGLLTNFQIIWQ